MSTPNKESSPEQHWVSVRLSLPTAQASAKGWRLVWDALRAAVMREPLRLYRSPLNLSFSVKGPLGTVAIDGLVLKEEEKGSKQ